MTEPVEWETPPNLPKYDWSRIAEQLRSHPMRWARVFENDRTSIVNAIRQGSITAVTPDLGFEVRTSNNERGSPRMCTLYMRYNPTKEDGLRAAIHTSRREKNAASSER